MIDKRLLYVSDKINRAKNRKEVFLKVSEKPVKPSEIVRAKVGKYSESYFAIVSRALNELIELKVVEVVNPNEKWGRIYMLTNFGKKVKEYLVKK